jgi:hypothetical protein
MGIPTVTVLVLFMSNVDLIRLLGEYKERPYDQVNSWQVYLIDEVVNVTGRNQHAADDCSA